MNKDVLITINGLQVIDDSDEAIEVMTIGEYYNKNNKHYLIYEDVDEDNGAKTRNIIKVSEQRIEIKRIGMVSTTMVFESDKINKSFYSTPFGDLAIEIETNHIDVVINEKDMDINIDYSLSINNQHMNDCQIRLAVKEVSQE